MIVLWLHYSLQSSEYRKFESQFPELLKGLFVKYNEDVATIYDLRFPRIVIPCWQEQHDSGIGCKLFRGGIKIHLPILESLVFPVGAVFAAGTHYRICTDFIFLHPVVCISWRCRSLCIGLQPVMERGIKSP